MHPLTMKPTIAAAPSRKSLFSNYRATSALTIALVFAWSPAAHAHLVNQIVMTSPDIQLGAPMTLLAFSGNAARRGEPNFDGARACGLNKIVRAIDSNSSQFFAALFNKTQISAASIASSLQGTVFYQVDLTGVAVDEIIRSDTAVVPGPNPPTPDNFLSETIVLHATTGQAAVDPAIALMKSRRRIASRPRLRTTQRRDYSRDL